MDTSSPWGQESAESTAASPWGQQAVQAAAVVEQQPQEATGWADFGAFSGGGEGMESKMEQMESTERLAVEEKEGWSPAMVSSPEATMLEHSKDIKDEEAGVEAEQSNRDDGGASPLLEERLQPDEMQGAVEEEKTIVDSSMVDQKKADSVESNEVVAESAEAQPTGEREDGAS